MTEECRLFRIRFKSLRVEGGFDTAAKFSFRNVTLKLWHWAIFVLISQDPRPDYCMLLSLRYSWELFGNLSWCRWLFSMLCIEVPGYHGNECRIKPQIKKITTPADTNFCTGFLFASGFKSRCWDSSLKSCIDGVLFCSNCLSLMVTNL